MFFMHPTNEALKSRSIFFTSNSSSATTTASPTTVLFKRDATEEEIYKKWEAEKGELTNDFKRKSRAARKKSKKIQRSSSRFQ